MCHISTVPYSKQPHLEPFQLLRVSSAQLLPTYAPTLDQTSKTSDVSNQGIHLCDSCGTKHEIDQQSFFVNFLFHSIAVNFSKLLSNAREFQLGEKCLDEYCCIEIESKKKKYCLCKKKHAVNLLRNL